MILSQDPNSVQEASIGRKFGGEASNTIGTDGFGTLNDSWPSSALNETHRYGEYMDLYVWYSEIIFILMLVFNELKVSFKENLTLFLKK